MNLKDYRLLFIAVTLVLLMIGALFIFSFYVELPKTPATFSEIWILGSGRTVSNYPFNMAPNETKPFYVSVRNYLGYAAYYVLYVKFRNQTQSLPNFTTSEPSQLEPLFEYQFFVVDGGTQEVLFNFRILEVSRYDDSVVVSRMSINDTILLVNSSARWDQEYKGFYYQLFFELWLYNTTSHIFQFHNRFIGIWLNMTG